MFQVLKVLEGTGRPAGRAGGTGGTGGRPAGTGTVHVPSYTLRTWNMVPHPRGGNVILDEFLKYTEKSKMRENPKNKYSTGVSPCVFTFLPKVEYYPMVDTHILV